jgi:hypothetical protein
LYETLGKFATAPAASAVPLATPAPFEAKIKTPEQAFEEPDDLPFG